MNNSKSGRLMMINIRCMARGSPGQPPRDTPHPDYKTQAAEHGSPLHQAAAVEVVGFAVGGVRVSRRE